jgi:AcrR family transcriptional regulator
MYQDLIFESAECVFGEKGFDGATMQEIAAEAGVSLKTVYASYPGKRELYDAIMLARGQSMFEAVQEAHESASSPIEKLVLGTRAFVDYLFAHKDWSRIHVRSQISWAMRPEDGEAAKLWDLGQRAHTTMFRDGIEAGVFCEDDPEEVSLMLRAMTRVQVVQAIERGETDREAVADRLIARLLRMACKGDVDMREAG